VISRFFIDRPVFAAVLSIVITLAGLMSMRALPIAQYPNIVPPEVSVSASYSGASAETVAQTVAAPLEQQINGVDDMLYMRSTNTGDGTMTLTVTFKIGTNPDQATINVNNRVQRVLPTLPQEVQRTGVRVDKKSSSILQAVILLDPTGQYSPIYLNNYALLNVIDDLKRVPGVGDASLFGAGKDYSMRIWLRPDKLAQYSLTPSDVSAAIQEQNAQFAAGRFGEEPDAEGAYTYTATTDGRLPDAAAFENIILRSDSNAATLRLKDVARVELGTQAYNSQANYNGKPAAAIGIYLQPGANALETAEGVKARMEELKQNFPDGITYAVPYDTTKFVQVSIDEVIKTFIEAIMLVVLVVFVFLQNIRATLIPIVAVPISIVGTFAGMYMLGFSINLLTLFGLILAIGIVVDDAIVVLENVERIMRTEKLPPKAAARKAMDEVTGPVIAIVLVLCAVFVPVAFMGGLAGEMYRQFAVTIADVGHHLRHRRADPDAGAVRPGAEAGAPRAGPAVPPVQPVLRPADLGLHRRRPLLPEAGGGGAAAVRRHDRGRRLPVPDRPRLAGAGGGPGLSDRRRLPAAGRLAGADGKGAGDRDRDHPEASGGQRSHRRARLRPAVRRAEDLCRHRLRAAEGLVGARRSGAGCPQPAGAVHGHECRHQGCDGAGLQPAADHGHEHDRRLRRLCPGPHRRRLSRPGRRPPRSWSRPRPSGRTWPGCGRCSTSPSRNTS
jgi:preprotein translocase subunit SecF